MATPDPDPRTNPAGAPALEARAAAVSSLAAARVGPYLLLRHRDPTGDEHVDVFELRAGPLHLESFSGNHGLPEQAACDHLAAVLGRLPVPEWQAIAPEARP